MSSSSRKVYGLLGLPIDAVTLEEAANALHVAARERENLTLATPNLNFLRTALEDGEFRASVVKSELSLVDGAPVLWMARLLGIPTTERVAGSTLFERLRAGPESLRVYFFGGPDGAAERACASLTESGALACAGFSSPGFGSIEDLSSPSRLAHINASGADFLVLALGAAKGQAWILRNRDSITLPVVAHLGAVINFAAGTVRRAPMWMQRAGLEWFWRVLEEPHLWRRYCLDGTALIKMLFGRVIPYGLWLRRHSGAKVEPLNIEVTKANGLLLLRLAGDCAEVNRRTFALALEAAVQHEGDVYLDLGDVTFLDPAGLGLILQLEGIALRRSSVLRITDLAPQLRPVLRWNAMTHLLA